MMCRTRLKFERCLIVFLLFFWTCLLNSVWTATSSFSCERSPGISHGTNPCILKKASVECKNAYWNNFTFPILSSRIKIKSISLKSICGLKRLESGLLPASMMQYVEIMNITNVPDLVEISPGFLGHFPRLRILKITHCALKKFPSVDTVHGRLAVLILNNNQISSLVKKSLSRLPRLSRLDLNNNRLTTLAPQWIPKNNQLKHLSLAGNRLTGLDPQLGALLPLLRSLRLQRNLFTTLHLPSESSHHQPRSGGPMTGLKARQKRSSQSESNDGILPIFPRLEVLDLSRNRITRLADVLFKAFSALRIVRLRRNKISKLGTGVFYVAGGDPGSVNVGLRVLDLSGNTGIVNVTVTWTYGLDQLKELSLAKCGVSHIEESALNKFSQLERLDMRDNLLTQLERGTLQGLTALVTLRLDANKLTHIQHGAFQDFGRLVDLSLAGNQLRSLQSEDPSHLVMRQSAQGSSGGRLNPGPPLSMNSRGGLDLLKPAPKEDKKPTGRGGAMTRSVLSPLSGLVRLDLSRNQLTVVRSGDLTGLARLEELDLRGNAVTRVEGAALRPLTKLRKLSMDSKSVHCDCRLMDTLKWMQERGVNVTARCALPPPFSGQPLSALRPADLSSDHCAPILPSEPRLRLTTNANRTAGLDHKVDHLWVLMGLDLHLLCHVTGVAGPGPVKWERVVPAGEVLGDRWRAEEVLTVGRLLSTRCQDEEKESSATSTITTPNGACSAWMTVLQVTAAQMEDEGRYRCTSETGQGVVVSNILFIKIYTLPRFTSTPSPVISAMERDTVEITCGAEGRPQPTTALRKVGGSDFPAAKSRRMLVFKDDAFFYITNVRRVDAGNYTCQSASAAGKIDYNFTLKVNTPARFTSLPNPREQALLGAPLVLRVEVDGIPAPSLQWVRAGHLLNASTRIHFSMDKRMLVVNDVRPGDAGVYTVTVVNALKSRTYNITVDVIDANGHIYPGSREPPSGLPGNEKRQPSDPRRPKQWLSQHWIGVIIIAVVLCVVITSLLWVLALYCLHWRKHRRVPAPIVKSTNPGVLHYDGAALLRLHLTDCRPSTGVQPPAPSNSTSDYHTSTSCESGSPQNEASDEDAPPVPPVRFHSLQRVPLVHYSSLSNANSMPRPRMDGVQDELLAESRT